MTPPADLREALEEAQRVLLAMWLATDPTQDHRRELWDLAANDAPEAYNLIDAALAATPSEDPVSSELVLQLRLALPRAENPAEGWVEALRVVGELREPEPPMLTEESESRRSLREFRVAEAEFAKAHPAKGCAVCGYDRFQMEREGAVCVCGAPLVAHVTGHPHSAFTDDCEGFRLAASGPLLEHVTEEEG